MLTLTAAFQIGNDPELVAFTGAGGKTTLMMLLAKELPGKVLLTTTTRMFAAQIKTAESTLPAVTCHYPDLALLDDKDIAPDTTIVVGPIQGDKVTGVPLDLPQRLLAHPDIDTVLVEADGAKMMPVKAPAAHEPALPVGVTLVVPVVGMNALGGRIKDVAHRPELVARLLHKRETDRLTIDDIACLLSHKEAGLKWVPAAARVIVTINKVETASQLQAARNIARLVLQRSRVQQVVLSSTLTARRVVEVQRRVTAVVLAAGQSQRMGRSKQLLPWGDTTILGQTLRNLKESAVFDIIVVTGAEAEEVSAIAQEEAVPTIYNEQYATGEMLSSLKTAVAQLPANRSAVLVMLADQPMVTAPVIDQIVQAYWWGGGSIVAPEYKGRRGNPVLIDRRHFAELLALPHDAAPRNLLQRHPVNLVPTTTDVVLHDIDHLEDYERYRLDDRNNK
jgi:molybdenum cofactor cytidylyltransferase